MMSIQQKTAVNVIEVVNSSWSNAALDDEGRVWTWGNSNSSYRFGRETSAGSNRVNPYNRGGQVIETIDANVNLPFILQISGSVENTLALDREGNVWSWGYSASGALGRSGSRERPGKVALPAGVKAKWIAAAYHGGKIIDTNGNIWVWGEGSEYGLGTGSTSDVSQPVQLTLDASSNPLPTNFIKISSSDFDGEASAIAVTEDGKIFTWGNGGSAATAGARRPKQTGLNKDIKKICTGNGSFGFLTNNGEAWSWGDNRTGVSNGRLGHGNTNHLMEPKRIENVINSGTKPAPKFRDLSLYAWSMCAVDYEGNLYGCGQNMYNKHTGAGTPTTLTKYLPNGVPADTKIFIVSEGYTSTSYVDVHGNAYVTGESDARGDNNNDGSEEGPWVHFTGSAKPLFTRLGSSPTSEAKRYNTLPRTTLDVKTNIAADEVKYVILYPDDTEQYTDGETFYSKTFAEIEQPYYNKGTDPQLLLSPNYDLWSSRYYANPKITEKVFDALYDLKESPEKGMMNAVEGSGNKAFIKPELVSHNSIVWIQTRNAAGTTRMIYRFDNYYTQTKAWFDGVKLDDSSFALYPPELVGGGYGLFLDRYGNLIPGDPPFGYDIVKPVPNNLVHWSLSPKTQLDEENAEDGYKHRVDRSKEIFLTELSQKGDDATKAPRVTFTYEKDPLMWVGADLFFVDESGGGIDVKIGEEVVKQQQRALFAPKGVAHVEGQDPYLPPEAVDPQAKVVGYSIGTRPDGSAGSYIKADFPSGFKPILEDYATIYIVYAAGVVSVTERFIDISDGDRVAIKNNNGQLSTEINLKTGSEDYEHAGPIISGYVIVGHEVEIHGVTTPTYYPWEDDHYEPRSAYIEAIDDNAEVRFLYKADTNGNKIPDDEEGRVLVRWIAVNASNTAYVIAQQTVYGNGKEGVTVTIHEDQEHVLKAAQYDPKKWLFRPGQDGDTAPYDPRGSAATRDISLSVDSFDEVYFYYDEDNNENGAADKLEGHFTEKYKLAVTKGDLVPPKADTASKWLGGQTYSKAVPLISGYVSVGYVIEADGMDSIPVERVGKEQTGNVVAVYEIPFEDTREQYTVTFFYKKDQNGNNIPDDEEGSVTVRWVGETYAGNRVELAQLVIEGYIGDDVTDLIYPPTRIDDIWKPSANNIPNEIILSAAPQEYMYEYVEAPEFSTITIEIKSTDGNLDFFYQYSKKLTDEAFDVMAFVIPTYRVKGYVHYDNYGNEMRSGTGDAVTIDPGTGSQRVVFIYESTVTTVVIRAVDSEDSTNILLSQTITDAVIGQKYAATAPYVDETWVLTDEMIQVVDVEEGTNYITFEYEKATGNVTVLLKENDANGRIIKVLSETVNQGDLSVIEIPGLEAAYYTKISVQAQTVDYKGAEPTPKIIEYYYEKERMDVSLQAIDESDGDVFQTEFYAAAARKGESYTAYAPTIKWYTVTENSSKSVYADPASVDNRITVAFRYKKDNVGKITVRSFYKDSEGAEVDLSGYTVQSLVGSKFYAFAGSFPGFELADDAMDAVQVIVNANDDLNKISFEYIDLRKTIGVFTQIESDEATRKQISEDKHLSGSDVILIPPYMNNHLVVGYIVDAGETIDVEPETFESLTLDKEDVLDGMSVVFVYKPYEDIVESKYVYVTIEGVTGAVTHYRYVKRMAKGELPKTLKTPAEVFAVPGYALDSAADFDIDKPEDESPIVKTFHYHSLATTVTIKMVDGTGAEVAESFAVGATANSPFTYNAPNVPYHYLAGSSLGKADPVLSGGESEIVFTYERITSQVTVIAKENDASGRVIGVFEIANPKVGTDTYAVPDLTADDYTANQPTVEITYDGTNGVSAEAYYTKDLTDVAIEAQDDRTGADLGTQTPLMNQRKGEAIAVSAPNIAGYMLIGSAWQIVIADGIAKAIFKYRSLENDEVAVKAVDTDGNILQSYVLKGNVGETVSAEPPVIEGWKTSDTEKSARIGTDREIVFRYAKNVVTVTENTVDIEGAMMRSATTEIPMGGSYTAYAPHIPGYVVEGSASHVFENLVADAAVTFVVKPVEAAVVLVTVVGDSAEGELYRDVIIRPKKSGEYKVEAKNIPEYRLIGSGTERIDVQDEDIKVAFEYESLFTIVSIFMLLQDSAESLAIFRCVAMTGESFTFKAPIIVDHDVSSNPDTITLPEVLPNGASQITFTYLKKPTL